MISAVILAAGLSRRLGRPKQLLKLGDKTIIERVVANVAAANISQTVVVLGAHSQKIEPLLKTFPVETVYNPSYEQGIGSSVSVGTAVVDSKAEGIMFVVGDQPLFATENINRLIDVFLDKKPLIVKPDCGMAMIFARELREELLSLAGDVGGRQLIKKYQSQVVTVPGIPIEQSLDIDTEEDYIEMLRLWKSMG